VSDRDLLLALYCGASFLMMVLAIPLIQRRVKPNGWYGFRFPRTLSDERVWYEVNAHFGRRLFVVGFVIGAASLLLYPVPSLDLDAYALAMTAIVLTALVIAIAQSVGYMRQL
jgi:uncharacterized membrane protein